MQNIIVIGGGPAGVTAALRASELGAAVTLVERDRLGGTCTNDGCVPTRVLARAARLLRNADQFSSYGLVGEAPQVDLASLMSSAQDIVYKIHEKKQLIHHLESSGVKLYLDSGEASFVDEHTLALGDGRRLQADSFIISAGGHPRRLTFPGAEFALTHSDIWNLKTLPKSLLIVGGAATGSQVASVFNAFGSQVTLFEVGPHILGIEDEIVSRTVQEAFQKRGVQIVTGIQGVERIEQLDTGLAFYYKLGDTVHAIRAEAVMLAVGWPGNLDSLNLEAAGVKTERGYIQVDDYLRTSTPHIFAAGDITGRMMLVQSAGYEAQAAAENAVLGVGQRQKHTIVPHGGFTDPEYGSVGLTEAKARTLHDAVVSVVPYAHMDRAVIDGHAEGYCKLIASRETHRILGAHVVGEQALEIVHLVAAGMAADMWVEQLAELEIAYPTYTAIVGVAARRLVSDLGVRPLSPEWRVLGKSYAAEWERAGNL